MRIVSIDLETTGLDPDTCEVLEFAAVLDNGDDTPVGELDTFRFRVKKPTYSGEPYALAMHSKLFKEIADAPIVSSRGADDVVDKPYMLGRSFAHWLRGKGIQVRGFNVAGKNFANFDARFLNRMQSVTSFFQWNHRVLDPASMYVLRRDVAVPSTKECVSRARLSKLFRDDCATFDGSTHTATYDARIVVALTREGLRGHWREQC